MAKLTPHISLRMSVILVVSVIVGSGVFKKIAPMSAELGSPLLVIFCWVLAGLISLAGALSNAEMASMFPDSGGEFIYYQKVYGRFFAFLYGWGNFTVIKTASIAALAYIFAQSFHTLFPLPEIQASFVLFGFDLLDNLSIKLLASGMIAVLSFVNYRGVHFAERLSTGLTYTMLVAVSLFIVVGLFSPVGSLENLTQSSAATDPNHFSTWELVKAITLASLGAFWGYEGWNQICYLGEEVENPQRNLPLALGFGTAAVMAIYVLLNLVFARTLPVDAFVAINQNPNAIAAVEVARRLLGGVGGTLLAGLILCTTFTATNSTVLMSARIYYAMARDGLFFKRAAAIHPHYKTPGPALAMQAVWAVGLVWSGSFDQLTDMLIFASFIFYGSTALGVIILRIRQPNLERKYRVVGYPFVPAAFCLFSVLLVVITLISQPGKALWGLLLIGTGVPLYFYWRK